MAVTPRTNGGRTPTCSSSGRGGGRDLLAAKTFGQPNVLGIEILVEHAGAERQVEE